MNLHESDELSAGQTTMPCFGPVSFSVSQGMFPQPGPYVISVKLTSLVSGPTKGDVLDQKNIQFYVESDPPSRGLFEAYEAIEGLSEENAHLFGYEDRGLAGGIVLKYNVEHPAYLKVQNDVDKVAEHLFRFGSIYLCKYDLASEEPKLFTLGRNPNTQDLVEQLSSALGRLMYLYHKATG